MRYEERMGSIREQIGNWEIRKRKYWGEKEYMEYEENKNQD